MGSQSCDAGHVVALVWQHNPYHPPKAPLPCDVGSVGALVPQNSCHDPPNVPPPQSLSPPQLPSSRPGGALVRVPFHPALPSSRTRGHPSREKAPAARQPRCSQGAPRTLALPRYEAPGRSSRAGPRVHQPPRVGSRQAQAPAVCRSLPGAHSLEAPTPPMSLGSFLGGFLGPCNWNRDGVPEPCQGRSGCML